MAKPSLISLLMCRLCRLCLFCVYPVLATVFMICLLISASIQDWDIRVCCNQAYCVDMCRFDLCLLTRLSFVFLLVFLLICECSFHSADNAGGMVWGMNCQTPAVLSSGCFCSKETAFALNCMKMKISAALSIQLQNSCKHIFCIKWKNSFSANLRA